MSKSPPFQPLRIGQLKVFGRIAMGQRSVVWAASARQFGGFSKTVAIKCMTPEAAVISGERQAFMLEATIGGAMDHPNLAHVFDVGVWRGRPYMVMELVRGWPLRSVVATAALTRKPIPLPAALSMAHTAAEGLQFLHGIAGTDGRPLGLVHRAVDDTNVLVARTGHAKVIDFGLTIPTAIQQPDQAIDGPPSPHRAPELSGRVAIDRRADVFALGVLLGSLCKNTPLPFAADLRAVVARATAQQPRNRFGNARDFQRSLEAVAAARDLTITPAATARFLDELYAPGGRDAPASASRPLPGLEQARAAQKRPAPNGGRTRVRITRSPSLVKALRKAMSRRRLPSAC